MARSPAWKVYRDKEYVAAFKYAEDAAAFIGCMPGEVRHRHGLVVWREGHESFPAAESYDQAARIMSQRRIDAAIIRIKKKNGGKVPRHLADALGIAAG